MSRFLRATALALLLLLPVARAATPKTAETQGMHPKTTNCVVIDDGNGLACAGAAPEVARTARTWMEERVAALRAKPQLREGKALKGIRDLLVWSRHGHHNQAPALLIAGAAKGHSSTP